VFPAILQRLVDQDNHKFEEWCAEMADMRKQSVDKGKAKHEEVKELYELLPVQEGPSTTHCLSPCAKFLSGRWCSHVIHVQYVIAFHAFLSIWRRVNTLGV